MLRSIENAATACVREASDGVPHPFSRAGHGSSLDNLRKKQLGSSLSESDSRGAGKASTPKLRPLPEIEGLLRLRRSGRGTEGAGNKQWRFPSNQEPDTSERSAGGRLDEPWLPVRVRHRNSEKTGWSGLVMSWGGSIHRSRRGERRLVRADQGL
jgi:hypothetical protein